MPDQHEPVPLRGQYAGHPVPDLDRLPRERWEEVLRQVPPAVREFAASALSTHEDVLEAHAVAREINYDEYDRKQRAREAIGFPPPVPVPEAPRPLGQRRAPHQVNFRLHPVQYEKLVDAAEFLGMKPSQLARFLTLRGVSQVLAERDR